MVPPPFSCTYSPNLPELLTELQCSIAITTYQAGKVVIISAKDHNHLVQLPRTFDRAMGMALEGDRLAIATKDEVQILRDSPALAKTYPKSPGQYDALYVPRATYYTGQVDIHDLHWGVAGLWAVNTSFSCLVLVNERYSWTPKWQPFYIDKLESEDRCHLNGLAMQNGAPKYVTALGTGNGLQQWRKTLPNGGIIIDVETNEPVLTNLPMPHSPTLAGNDFYCLLSATGALIQVAPDKGTYQIVKKIKGFVRGMAIHGDYMFIGLSKLRQNSSTFKHLQIAEHATEAGIIVLHLPTQAVVGQLKYRASVDEIYDVQIIPKKRPGILNTTSQTHKYALSLPQATFWAKFDQT